jgi:light-regulated signal transduction histidine kinase (bacteriophytochrome)
MSTEISNKQVNENLDYQLQLKDILGHLVERLGQAIDFIKPLTADPESLLNLTGAQGAVVCAGDDIRLIGQTPDREAIPHLLTWLTEQFDRDLFVTDSLPTLYPAAATYKNLASGLLAIAISKIQHRYILWFRPELLQTVTWAGNPNKPKLIEADGSLSIFPRKSFEVWQETVRLKSSPWLQCEIDRVVELRQAIIDIVLRQADELASINLELQRSNTELDAFAYIASHDLKEPLRGIHNYATFLLEDYGQILPEDGAEKLQTLVRLTHRMESLISSLLKFSRLGRQELQMEPLDLNQVLGEIGEIFQMNPQWAGCVIRIPRPLPVVWGDRILVGEIFTNLISNGFKYNNNTDKWVEIGWQESSQDETMANLYIRDNGIGIREKHLESVFKIFKRLHPPGKYGGGTGAGLTIVKKIIERHGGSITIESVYGDGTTFWFTLPAVEPTSPTSPSKEEENIGRKNSADA